MTDVSTFDLSVLFWLVYHKNVFAKIYLIEDNAPNDYLTKTPILDRISDKILSVFNSGAKHNKGWFILRKNDIASRLIHREFNSMFALSSDNDQRKNSLSCSRSFSVNKL